MIKLPKRLKRYVPIISDYGFKITFGNEHDTRFLAHALKALIDSPYDITVIAFEKHTVEGLTKDARSGIYDVHCVDSEGTQFIIEMQLAATKEFVHRLKFYAFHRFNTMVAKGKVGFSNLNKIYCISFLGRNLLETSSYHSVASLYTSEGELLDEQITFILIELDKFKKKPHEITSELDKLIFFMLNLHKKSTDQEFPLFFNDEWIQSAIKEVDTRNMTPDQYCSLMFTLLHNAEAQRLEEKRKAKFRRTLEYENRVLEKAKFVLEKESAVLEKETSVLEKESAILEKETFLLEKESSILEKETFLLEKESSVLEKESLLLEKGKAFEAQAVTNAQAYESAIAKLRETQQIAAKQLFSAGLDPAQIAVSLQLSAAEVHQLLGLTD